jgi:DNA-binding LacI/PurR family transcriptional regulator
MPKPSQDIPVLAGRPEATRAAQYIVRVIQGRRLTRGDRVPSQQELCAATGFSNNAMTAAMKVLVANGMLTRRVRVGSVVVDPDRAVRGLWRVGVAILSATASQPYYGELFHRVQAHLQSAGCVTYVYIRNDQVTSPDSETIAGFDYLAEDVKRRPLDGLLDLSGLSGEDWVKRKRAGLAMVHAGSWETAPAGVVIEQGRMAEASVTALMDRGCKRLAVVSIGPPVADQLFWSGFVAGLKNAGQTATRAQSLSGGEGPVGGRIVAEALIAMPAAKRPDGLLVIDDRIAMGLAATLAQTDYRPRMVVQTNLQAPLAFALPVLHYEVDAEELATRAAAMLLDHLRNPDRPLTREWLYPRIMNPGESHMSNSLPTPQPRAG